MHDELDNGHGSSRVKMFKHSHEIISGHTSSRSIAFIGFDINDAIYNYKNCDSHAEIISNSNRIINLIDTCGYKKYMKTNLYTFSIYNLQYNIFIIDDQMLYLNQLENVMLLKIPILLVVNKFDKIKKNNRENSVLKTIHVIASMITPTSDPFFISNDQDIEKAMPSFLKGLICPVITVSCVTGQNLNLLRLFLSSVPSPNTLDQLKFESVRFEISKVHNREDGVIVVGRLISGRISLQDALFIGPNINGDFIKVSAQSIEQNHSKTNTIFAGQQSGINLGFISGCKIRAGMVIIDTHLNAIPCKEFMASITVFSQHHLFVGLEVPINVCSIRQIVKIIDIPETVEKGKPCLIKFKFKHRIECIKVMSKIIIRFNKLVAKGFVSSIIKFKLPKII
ncbi:hypothetical protein A3Q56_00597 [Intoshia linei]|uniref:Tr-type G domain-containing protein n=1 Tax=Intoshia linei TaxID=1819745 RepID=A0A177BD51_9BILA|nr:hypothetical protein A3Q56_00597 [Intoshia linei]